jgi:hypothetical protein
VTVGEQSAGVAAAQEARSLLARGEARSGSSSRGHVRVHTDLQHGRVLARHRRDQHGQAAARVGRGADELAQARVRDEADFARAVAMGGEEPGAWETTARVSGRAALRRA